MVVFDLPFFHIHSFHVNSSLPPENVYVALTHFSEINVLHYIT